MITRVLDADGRVLHDCAAAGCDVSWDGYALRDVHDDVAGYAVRAGERVPGGADPDPRQYAVEGNTARLRA